jgi:hypothetical protein
MLEWIASVMMAIDPVIAPAAILSAIRVALEAIESAAAGALRGACASGPMARAGAPAAPPPPGPPPPRGLTRADGERLG